MTRKSSRRLHLGLVLFFLSAIISMPSSFARAENVCRVYRQGNVTHTLYCIDGYRCVGGNKCMRVTNPELKRRINDLDAALDAEIKRVDRMKANINGQSSPADRDKNAKKRNRAEDTDPINPGSRSCASVNGKTVCRDNRSPLPPQAGPESCKTASNGTMVCQSYYGPEAKQCRTETVPPFPACAQQGLPCAPVVKQGCAVP